MLWPGDALVINAFAILQDCFNFFPASIEMTFKSIFPGVRMNSNGGGAIFFVATDHAAPEFAHKPDLTGVHPEAFSRTEAAMIRLVDAPPEHGRVLTDDYNPVEFYDARNREELRKRLAMMAREM